MSTKSVEIVGRGAPEENPLALLALSIEKTVLEEYERRAGLAAPQLAIVETLTKFKDIDPKEDVLMITGEELRELRDIVGKISSADELLRCAKRGMTVALKGTAKQVHIGLTENQKKRVKDFAASWKCEEGEAFQRVLKEAVREKLGAY